MKMFCLCVAVLFALVTVNVASAQDGAGCPCAAKQVCTCKVVAPCAPCVPCAAPCAVPCYPVYPYYPAYRVGLFGCVRPVVAYPYYGYYGYYPRCWW